MNPDILNAKNLVFSIVSDVYAVPHWEDGEPREHLAFYAQAEDELGHRWNHFFRATTEQMHRGAAEALIGKLVLRMTGASLVGTKMNPELWHETTPAYGSEAYQLNMEEIRDNEMAADAAMEERGWFH